MNSVNLIGILKECVDDTYRYLEYSVPFPEDGSLEFPRILVRYWNKQPGSRLITLPVNTRVAIHAHLDLDEKVGTVLIVEELEALHK